MRNKLIIISLITSLILSVCFCVALADAKLNVVVERSGTIDNLTQKIIITGKSSEYTTGEYVSLKLYNKGGNELNLSFSDYKYIGQTLIDDDGSFRFEFDFKEIGDYSIVAATHKEKFAGEKYISDISAISQMINGLNTGAVTADDAVSKVAADNKELMFDVSVYSKLNDLAKKKVWSDMIAEKSGSFNVENIYESFARYTLINSVNSASDHSLVKEAIEYYNNKYLNLQDLSVEGVKSKMNSNEITSLYDLMRNHNLSDIPAIKLKYIEAVILSKYKNTTNYLNVAGVLSDCQVEADIISEFNAYTNLSDTQKKAFCLYLSDERANVVSIRDNDTGLKGKIKYALENIQSLVEKYSTPVINGGGGAPGGGGGGGAGSGNITVSDDYIPENKVQDFEYVISLSDVKGVSWAAKQINALYEKGIINGKAPGEYKPYDNVTRAEITKMISVATGVYDENAESVFSDVKNHWAYRYISSAANKGYIMGMNKTEFAADKPITRQDTAVILYRIIQYSAKSQKITDITKSFIDSEKISDYARNSVLMLAEYGILNGFEDGSFKPQETLNRAQAAVVIYNMLEFINN